MEYTVIDIETTGLKPDEGSEITEIAGCNVVNGNVITIFSSLIKIDSKINDFIYQLTGIDNEMVKNAPTFDTVFKYFMDTLKISEETTLIIHNSNFDYNFISYWINKYNIEKNYIDRFLGTKVVCSLKLAQELIPNISHKLEDLKKYFGFGKTKSHRALNDVLITNLVYKKLLEVERRCQDNV